MTFAVYPFPAIDEDNARYAQLFFLVNRIEVSAEGEQDFNARWRVSRGNSRLILLSAFERQV
jgi:hypothetical protein